MLKDLFVTGRNMVKHRRIRIGVNTRLLLSNRLEGIGRVTHEVLKRLTQSHPEVEFYFFFDRAYDEKFLYASNVKPIVIYPQARHPFLYLMWFEYQIPRYVKKYKIDLFFSPDAYLSTRLTIPQVPIFHDIAFEYFPETVTPIERLFYKTFFPKYAKISKRLVAVSKATKKDLIKLYGVESDRIQVIYNGYDPNLFHSIPYQDQVKARNHYSKGCPYFLSVATIQPRKNVNRLLMAFDRFRSLVHEPVKLVLVGRKGWRIRQALAYYKQMKYKDDVIFTGYVDSKMLAPLYAGSIALCYISLYEGFGLPILEALACHAQVVYSNVSSMPEVAGPFGIPVDPMNIDSILQGMLKAYSDPPQYNKEALEKHLKQFSWDQAAQQYWEVLKSVLNE